MQRTVLILTLLLVPSLALGEIYKWVDEQGQVHFTDSPGHTSATAVTIDIDTSAAPHPEPVSAGEMAERLRKARLARQAHYTEHSDSTKSPSRDCVKARNKLALWQDRWERKSRRGYRQSEKIHHENKIADSQLAVTQSCG